MKKFLSVFCAIAMMATLIVPSYAADATFSVTDAVADENGLATIVVSVDLVDMYSMEYVITYAAGLKIAAKPERIGFDDYTDFVMTPGGNITKNPYKVMWDSMENITYADDAFQITFDTTGLEAGEYEVEFDCLAMNDVDESADVITATITVPAAEKPFAPEDAAEISDAFGKSYAYIRETKIDGVSSYDLCTIAALKGIGGFASAKFEFALAEDNAFVGNKIVEAWKAIEINGEAVDVAQLGEGFEYMVFDSVNINADADSAVWFRITAVDANGNTVYGAWQKIDTLAA